MSNTPPDPSRPSAPTQVDPFMQRPLDAGGSSGNALPVGTYLGEFELLGVVGEGGFGIVYRAWDHSLKRQVAVKEYMPSAIALRVGSGAQVQVKSERHAETFDAGLKSFVKEAQMLAQFDHPALVKVYRFWEANGSAYMVMPFYEGVTLRDLLRTRSERPDEATILGWIGPVADALAVIHAEQWYHRDIAPDNIMLLAGTGRPLLLDFGAARRVIGDMTQALTVILKPGYAPVEQYAEVPGMKQGPWTDVYALAAVAHFAVRGRTPPPSVGRLLNDSYEALAGAASGLAGRFSERFLAAIDRALAVRPDQRTPDVGTFKRELGLGEAPVAPMAAAATALPPGHAARGSDGGAASGLGVPLPGVATGMPTQAALAPTVAAGPVTALPPTVVMQTPPPAHAAARPGGQAAAEPEPAPGRAAARLPVAGLAAAALLLAAGGAWWALRPAAPVAGGAVAVPASTAGPAQAAPVAPPGATAAGAESTAAATNATNPANSANAGQAANAAPAAAGFDIAAEFARVMQAQTPGYGLDVSLEKSSLRIDRDKLSFTVRSLQEGHVYVFYNGADGQLQQLYPNGLTPAPRIAKGGTLKLPQGRLDFNVAGPAGVSRLLVMVSRWPRDHGEYGPREDNGFRSFPTGAAAAAKQAAHRGPLPLLAGNAQCPPGGTCEDAFGAAMTTFDVVP
ncbi:serine/threonine-protein kinase [Aquabacterium sp. OR-4]|uniref:serine/threonine-protein kinase n=1 Tax=Aquabacterium sp. OR-4 TaxID=2978127 RepID=UPI0028C6C1E0|nr:serine/threonine-protein kinase [Aquabacterium sp. OR-4]MDT7834135.1 serine/threonine-protein kinase [Aquabacterium sp. OR-4]